MVTLLINSTMKAVYDSFSMGGAEDMNLVIPDVVHCMMLAFPGR